MAYSMSNLCVKDAVSFTAVFDAKNDDFPEGDACKAWSNLQTIFKPLSSAKKHELEQLFNKSSLDREHTNPDEWFAELERIRMQLDLDFNTKITDDQMISQIIYNVHPVQYKHTIATIKRELTQGTKVTLESVKDDLRQIFGGIKTPKQKYDVAFLA